MLASCKISVLKTSKREITAISLIVSVCDELFPTKSGKITSELLSSSNESHEFGANRRSRYLTSTSTLDVVLFNIETTRFPS